uniref:Uncharacterized protein n=1 Tax=Pavo cristatus TaxID=9049 RepID=A0A8C9FWG3_PAVCR
FLSLLRLASSASPLPAGSTATRRTAALSPPPPASGSGQPPPLASLAFVTCSRRRVERRASAPLCSFPPPAPHTTE